MTHEEEIKRLNEKIEFLARTNMLYSDWEHRETQVTSELIRKGIEEAKANAELRAEIARIKQRTWAGLAEEEMRSLINEFFYEGMQPSFLHYANFALAIEAKLKEKNV